MQPLLRKYFCRIQNNIAVFQQLSSVFSLIATTNDTISATHVKSGVVIAHKYIYSVVLDMNYLSVNFNYGDEKHTSYTELLWCYPVQQR
jgi:hypothetical protein